MWVSKHRYFYGLLLLSIIFILGLLNGPIVPDKIQSKNCARNIDLPFNLGVTLNCDTGIYLRLANNPALLFENKRVVNGRNLTPGNVEQATPGSTTIVWLISKPIIIIWESLGDFTDNLESNVKSSLNIVYEQLNINQSIEDSTGDFGSFIPIYIGYLLFHSLILISCFYFYISTLGIKLLSKESTSQIIILIGLIILINDVNKQFLFSPGPQIFRILCPILTIYFSSKILKDNDFEKKYLTFCLISGFLMLFYYIFFLAFVTVFFSYIVRSRKNKVDFTYILLLKNFFLSFLIFIFPSFVWFCFCMVHNTNILVYDMVQETFGYYILKEKFYSQGLFSTIVFFGDSILRTFYHSLIHSWIIVFLFFIPIIFSKIKLNAFYKDLAKVSFFFSIFAVLFFSFYSPVTSRMVYSSFLVFLPFIAEINRNFFFKIKNKEYTILIYFLVFVFYTFHTVNKTEPFGWYDEKGSYYFIY